MARPLLWLVHAPAQFVGEETPMANRSTAPGRDADPDPYPYLAAHVREALARDARLGELGVEVEVADETVVLSGAVTSPERREAAEAIAHDVLPDHRVRNDTEVIDLPEPTEAEHFP